MQILKNHIVPGEVLDTSQLQSQAAPLPTLTGQSLQARLRPHSVYQHACKHRRPVTDHMIPTVRRARGGR